MDIARSLLVSHELRRGDWINLAGLFASLTQITKFCFCAQGFFEFDSFVAGMKKPPNIQAALSH
jgi:hypothetical protein